MPPNAAASEVEPALSTNWCRTEASEAPCGRAALRGRPETSRLPCPQTSSSRTSRGEKGELPSLFLYAAVAIPLFFRASRCISGTSNAAVSRAANRSETGPASHTPVSPNQRGKTTRSHRQQATGNKQPAPSTKQFPHPPRFLGYRGTVARSGQLFRPIRVICRQFLGTDGKSRIIPPWFSTPAPPHLRQGLLSAACCSPQPALIA